MELHGSQDKRYHALENAVAVLCLSQKCEPNKICQTKIMSPKQYNKFS